MSVRIQIQGETINSPIPDIKQTIEKFIKPKNIGVSRIMYAGIFYDDNFDDLFSRLSNNSSIIVYTYPILNTPIKLFVEMMRETGGWKEISKSKPVATFNSGDNSRFIKNYERFTPEQKSLLEKLIIDYLSKKNHYPTNVKIYNNNSGNFYNNFFYVPEFVSVANKILDIYMDDSIRFISNYYDGANPKHILFVNLVFGDYYKPYFKPSLESNEEFIRVLREYNSRIGIEPPEDLPQITAEGGSILNSDSNTYKQKYIKYKNKYLQLKNILEYI